MCCSKIEDPPRFSCSNKTSNIEINLKRRNSLKSIKKYYKKINIIRNSWKGINSKKKSKTNTSEKYKCWLCNEEGHYTNDCP